MINIFRLVSFNAPTGVLNPQLRLPFIYMKQVSFELELIGLIDG